MKTLFLMRHAKSSWKDADVEDHERPLNKRGKRDAPRMGAWMVDNGFTPDLILCSTAKRAMKTADAVAASFDLNLTRTDTDALYLAAPEEIVEAIQNNASDDCDSVLVLAHNPGLEDLLDNLTGTGYAIPTAALAVLSLPIDSWRALSTETQGTLEALIRPKKLPETETA